MRARPVLEPFDAPDYLFETRWNGIRAQASIAGGQVRLHGRRQGDLTKRFPELSLLAYAAQNQPILLDGEIVLVDEHGRPNFDTPQWRLRLVETEMIAAEALRRPACYLATDLLFRGQRWLLGEPLQRRKKLMAEALHQSDCLYLAEQFEAEGRALFQAAVESGLEGILAKPKDGLYAPGGLGWLAVVRDREELVVGGYSMHIAGGSRTVELLLGAYDPAGQLTFVTSAKPPAEEPARAELFAVLNALQVEQPPFTPAPPYIACWVRPEVVVTIANGDFERVRVDVAPDNCLLSVDAPIQPALARPQAPRLTMLTTLPLPLDTPPPPSPDRPKLRVLG
ncbi:MAG TPA: hypothetical protein VF157_13520 [Chloroflexota bacterium]